MILNNKFSEKKQNFPEEVQKYKECIMRGEIPKLLSLQESFRSFISTIPQPPSFSLSNNSHIRSNTNTPEFFKILHPLEVELLKRQHNLLQDHEKLVENLKKYLFIYYSPMHSSTNSFHPPSSNPDDKTVFSSRQRSSLGQLHYFCNICNNKAPVNILILKNPPKSSKITENSTLLLKKICDQCVPLIILFHSLLHLWERLNFENRFIHQYSLQTSILSHQKQQKLKGCRGGGSLSYLLTGTKDKDDCHYAWIFSYFQKVICYSGNSSLFLFTNVNEMLKKHEKLEEKQSLIKDVLEDSPIEIDMKDFIFEEFDYQTQFEMEISTFSCTANNIDIIHQQQQEYSSKSTSSKERKMENQKNISNLPIDFDESGYRVYDLDAEQLMDEVVVVGDEKISCDPTTMENSGEKRTNIVEDSNFISRPFKFKKLQEDMVALLKSSSFKT